VRILDDAMNNTSIILLFEIGTTGLLFPGDAQIENWNYTLDRLAKNKRLRERLAGIDLYKVGHHGSRNATPRSLYKLWDDTPTLRPRTALMSTRSGIHGRSAATKVPRATLVTALERTFTLYSTETLTAAAPSLAVTAEIGTSTGFEPAD
jgi:hypothetical protein